MKIPLEKSKFIKLETAFLGYIVPHNVIKKDPEKISKKPNNFKPQIKKNC